MNKKEYLNINTDVKYVGMSTCISCHQDQYQHYIKTGMGRSFQHAIRKNSSIHGHFFLNDTALDLFYEPKWIDDSLYLNEYRLSKSYDTTYLNLNKIDFIVGSGNHTNSHLINNNGYLYQTPFTYYTQDSILDFPPGFENNKNSRFSRKMGLECVACHNSYPDFVLGSENKYNFIPTGIDCERCHGPGQLHVEKIKNQNITDTSTVPDYTIINPSKLPIDLQNDICSRCHLQGNSVLKPNKSFFDFLPGMYLKDIMDVYVPRYTNSENDFIMASHVDRMKLSECYIKSDEKMSCISCHNPHVSVHNSPPNFFNNKCSECHIDFDCNSEVHSSIENKNDCISCHMPKSKTTDIPHVKITDHKISIPNSTLSSDLDSIKEFITLQCVNNKNPSKLSKIQAYLQQFERFNPHEYYLDSAYSYLEYFDFDSDEGIYLHIYYYYLKEDYENLTKYVKVLGVDKIINHYLTKKDYSNQDAWTAYRIGESFSKMNDLASADIFYNHSVKLAPYSLEFRNKYATNLFSLGRFQFAEDEYNFIINEDNNYTSAYANLGFLYFTIGSYSKAKNYYDYALKLDPNHEKTLINMSQLLIFEEKDDLALDYINSLLKLYPQNKDGLYLLKKINES